MILPRISDVFGLHTHVEQKNILLSFRGKMTSELLSAILEIIECKLEQLNESAKIRKRLFNILVECLQNLYHHYELVVPDIPGNDDPAVLIMVAKNRTGYNVITGNYIYNEGVDALQQKLEEINKMSPLQLKELYKSVLDNGKYSKKGGGGLGMLDIARRSGEKLAFGFIPFKNATFFSLNINISDKSVSLENKSYE